MRGIQPFDGCVHSCPKGEPMSDHSTKLRQLHRMTQDLVDVADIVARLISTSWTRGDRLLCADCHELRGAESNTRGGEGRCDGCGDKEKNLWVWHIDDLPPAAREFVELSEWVIRATRGS